MDVAFPLVAMLLLVPLFIWAHHKSKQLSIAVDEAWSEAAETLGGSFVPAETRFFGSTPRRIRATVSGIDVEVDHYTVRTNKTSTTYTRLIAGARAPGGLEIRVTGASFLTPLATALGFQDVTIGAASFDEAYVVKANDVEAARVWLNGTVRKRIVAAAKYGFALEDGSVKAVAVGLEKNAADILTVVRAVVAFADGRQGLMRVWRSFAEAYGGKVKRKRSGWGTLDLELEGVPIRIDTTQIDGHHFTVATAGVVGAALQPFTLTNDGDLSVEGAEESGLSELADYSLSEGERDAAHGHIDEHLARKIAEFAPAEVRIESDEVTILWRGIAVDRDELEQASALAAALAAGPSRGPYR
jgi:hypothetical protein